MATYVSTTTFPYFAGCLGPANYPANGTVPSCTSMPRYEYVPSAFAPGGSGGGNGNGAGVAAAGALSAAQVAGISAGAAAFGAAMLAAAFFALRARGAAGLLLPGGAARRGYGAVAPQEEGGGNVGRGGSGTA